ncbi:hypothetical protein FOA52_015608 [Chlamydomonas sp. UWO 241]|nr:hypothetical protein FOA52_015608 [Chlamydomonas sp. UWO 241]
MKDLTIHPPGFNLVDKDVDVDALAASTQLVHLRLPKYFSLRSLAPLRGLVNLQSLYISGCYKVSDLASHGALLSLLTLTWVNAVLCQIWRPSKF